MSTGFVLAIAFDGMCATVCTYALVKGGRPERLGAVINLLAVGATWALRALSTARLAPADPLIFLIDALVAGAFFWIAIATIRYWPIWAAGFALADLFMSVCGALLPHVSLFAYHTGLGIYAYLALGALALGTLRLPADAERYLRNGSRRSWTRHLKETS